MTSTNPTKTIQSAEMSVLGHLGEGCAMSYEFHVVIENPITTIEAARITGYSKRQIIRFCVEFHETEGKSGLKSKKLGGAENAPWLIEKVEVEKFKKTNVDKTET